MAKPRRKRVRSNTSFVNLLIELAPTDFFRDCSFHCCEFVGAQGAEFDSCLFLDCNCEQLCEREATFSACQFGYTTGFDDEQD